MRILTIIAILAGITACQQVGFQKRKHLKGYYFSHAPRIKGASNDATKSVLIEDSLRPFLTVVKQEKAEQQKATLAAQNIPYNVELEDHDLSAIEPKKNEIVVQKTKRTNEHEASSRIRSNTGLAHKQTKVANKKNREFAYWYGLIGLSLFGAVHLRRNKKSRLSNWGNKNRKKGIALILAGLGANYVSNIYLGKNLADLGFTSSVLTRDILWGLTGVTLLSFPTNHRFANNFKNRTRGFVALFVLLSALGINSGIRMQNQSELSYSEKHIATYVADNHEYEHAAPFTGKELAWRIPLTIFFILFNVALAFGLAVLICSLSCSGFGVAAVLVGVLGYGGIIVGMIFTLRAIWKKPGSGRIKPTNSDDPNNDPDEVYFTNPVTP